MSSFLELLLFLFGLTTVLHVVARVWRVPVAADSCQCRPWLPTHWREPVEEGEEVRFRSEDGVALSGTFLPRLTEQSRGLLVFSHELKSDRWNALPYVEHLRTSGYDVFTFDYRGHGKSERRDGAEPKVQVGSDDVVDLKAAIRAARARTQPVHPPLGIVGVGKGAAVALCTAAEGAEIGALVLDSIQYRSADEPVGSSVRFRRWRAIRNLFSLSRGHERPRLDVMAAAANVDVPVLLVHGGKNVCTPLARIRDLANRIAGHCQLWVVPGARHAEAIDVAYRAYCSRVGSFLTRSLQVTRRETRPQRHEVPVATVPRSSMSSASAR